MEILKYTNIIDNSEEELAYDVISTICPYCNTGVNYNILPGYENENGVAFIAECPTCKKFNLLYGESNDDNLYSAIHPIDHKPLSENLRELSPSFCEIYEQTYRAKSNNLTELIGIGFGKALEQLVHDYLIKVQNDKPKTNFATNIKMLKNFDDAVINLTLSRFVRNDETHPIKESSFTVEDLIDSVECIVVFFDSKYSTFKLQSKITSLKPE